MIVILMGVSGSGKSCIGSELGRQLGWPFYDADDYHTERSKEKMCEGIPLDDTDRFPWLEKLSKIISEHIQRGSPLVLACSALKADYRNLLDVRGLCRFVYLKGSFELIKKRIEQRANHFFDPKLLKSQFDLLEEPQNALTIDIDQSVDQIVKRVRHKLHLNSSSSSSSSSSING